MSGDSDYTKDLDSRRSITRVVTYSDGAPDACPLPEINAEYGQSVLDQSGYECGGDHCTGCTVCVGHSGITGVEGEATYEGQK